MIDYILWDSEKFGIKIGLLHLPEHFEPKDLFSGIEEGEKRGYDLLYLKGVFLKEELLSDRIKLVDEKVVYSFIKNQDISFEKDARFSNVEDILGNSLTDDLLELAYESGKYSRYKIDKSFHDGVFKTLYREWISKSLSREIASGVLAFNEYEKIKGFLTYLEDKDNVSIGLIATAKEFSGMGIGTTLIKKLISKYPIGTSFQVATQKRNIVACHFYEKNGFEISAIENIYHIWLK